MTAEQYDEYVQRGREGEVKFLPTSDADRRGDAPRDRRLLGRRPLRLDPGRGAAGAGPAAAALRDRDPALARRPRARNANARDTAFFLGGGLYHHYVSAIADQMLYRAEWLTSYTPYQPEVSQGTLQSIFEFQTHICLLTGPRRRQRLALRRGLGARRGAADGRAPLAGGRKRAVLSRRRSTRSTGRPSGRTSRNLGPRGRRGARRRRRRDRRAAPSRAAVDDDDVRRRRAVAELLRRRRGLERRLARRAREAGALSVAVVAEAVSLALLAPPGERGVDIACGEAQSLGVPMHFGGPLLGFLACRDEHQRQIPGRLVGRDARRRGPARLLPDALDARAAHPPREGDLEHLHEPGADGARREHPHVAARQAGPARGRAAVPREGRVPEGRDREAPGLPDSVRRADVQRVRASRRPEPAAPLLVAARAARDPRAASRCRAGTRRPANRFLVAVTEMNTREEMDRLVAALGGRDGMSVEIEEKARRARRPRCAPSRAHEPLVFERSGEGKVGYSLPPLDVPEVDRDPARRCGAARSRARPRSPRSRSPGTSRGSRG